MSMAEAYRILGYRPHHYHQLPISEINWDEFERACDGNWPDVPGAKPGRRKFTREDWDAARGGFDFFTDFYSHFTPELIRTYPEAKVVVVQRDFESWWPSYNHFCIASFARLDMKFLNLILRLFQNPTPFDATAKQYYGFYGVSDMSEIDEAMARRAHREFFEEVRRIVPAERRLEFRLKDGWEPLCEFLGKPVPDVPFPRLNSMDDLNTKVASQMRTAWLVLGSLAGGVSAVVWYAFLR